MAQDIDSALRMLEFLRFLEQWRSGHSSPGVGAPQEEQVPVREYLEGWLASGRVLATCWCQELDLPRGSTYGDAAQKVLGELDEPGGTE